MSTASDNEESQAEPPSGRSGAGSGCDAAAAATATTNPASGSTAVAAATTVPPRTERSTLAPRTLRSRGTDGTARATGGERPPFSVALGRPEVRFRVTPERRAATRTARAERQRAHEARLRRYYADAGEVVAQAVAVGSVLADGPQAQQQQQQQPRLSTTTAAPEAGATRRRRTRRVGRAGLVGPDGAYDLEAVEAAHPHMAVRRRASTGCNVVPHDPSGWHTVARPAPLSPSALENVAYNARKTGMVVTQPPPPSSPPSSAPASPPPPLSQPLLDTASGVLAAGETGSRISAWRDECVKKSAAGGGVTTAPGAAEFPPRSAEDSKAAAHDPSSSLNVASFAVLCEDAAAAEPAAAEPGRGAVEVHTSVLRLLSAGVPPGMPEEQWAGAVDRVHCALSEHRSILQRHNTAAAAARLAETAADRAVPAGDACDASLRRATAPAGALDYEALRLVTPCAALREHLEWTNEEGGRLAVSLPPQHHYAKASHYHRSLLRGYVDDKVVDAKLRRAETDGGGDDPFCVAVVAPPSPSPPPPPAQLLGGGGGGHLTTGANLAGRRRTSVMHKLRATVDGTLSQGGGGGGGARGRMRRSGDGDGGAAAGAAAASAHPPLPLRSSSISSTGSQGSQGGAAMMGFLQTQQADRRERQRAEQQALIDETLLAAQRSLDSPRRRRRTRRRTAGCSDSGDDDVDDGVDCAAEGTPVRVHRRLRKPPPLRAADSVLEAAAQAAFGSALRAARPVRLTEAAGEVVNGLEYLCEEDEEAASEAARLPTVAAAAYPAYAADLRELRTTNGRMTYPSDEDDGGAPPPAGPVTPAARLRDAMLLPALGGSGGGVEAERRAGAAKPRLGRAAPPPSAAPPPRHPLRLSVSAVGGGEEGAPARPHTSEAALRHYLGVGCSGGGGGQRRRRQLRKHAPQACGRPSTQGTAGRQKVRETLEAQNDALQAVRTMKWKAMNRSRRQEQECA